MNIKKIGLFIGIAFALAWGLGFGYFALGGSITSPTYVALAAVIMLTPALTAIIVQKAIYKQPLADIGLKLRVNRWLLFAIFVPIVLTVITIFVSGLVPGARITNGAEAIVGLLNDANMPAEAIADVEQSLASTGAALPLVIGAVSILGAIVAGVTVNGALALGEELGWRGFLQSEMRSLGFWRSSYLIGALWGLWHLPLILNGHNYAQNPEWGVLFMTVFCMLYAPLHAYVVIKMDSVLAAAAMHGVINAIAGLPLYYVIGGSDLTIGVTGLAGFAVLAVANVALWLKVRNADSLAVIEKNKTSELAQPISI